MEQNNWINDTMHCHSLEDALAIQFGNNTRIAKTRRIHGGDINQAFELELQDGMCLFLKANTKEHLSFFTAEAAGLAAIAGTDTIRTPEILGKGTVEEDGGYSFLLMEFGGEKQRRHDFWETFACELAAMHQAGTDGLVPGGNYGFFQDNYIGASRQQNTAYGSWIPFFCNCRLKPQLQKAAHYCNPGVKEKIPVLLGRAKEILIEPDKPSLLHGDLWSGNFITGKDHTAWLIDPAAYVGHAEADLAMTELFGGFPKAFYDAYQTAAPLAPGYKSRRDLYNLYHLLNHLNLFGKSYLPSVERMIANILNA